MEKGDEPLSQHKEEIQDKVSKEIDEQGLSLFAKFGALGVIVALCLVFLRGGRSKVSSAGRHGAYEKSMA